MNNGTGILTTTINPNLVLNRPTFFSGNGSGTFVFAGSISGAGPLIKTGSSTMTLTGANTYTGGTVVRGGTLQVTTGGSITHTGTNMLVSTVSGDNGTLNITGGAVSTLDGGIGLVAGSSGTATVSSGTWNISGGLSVGISGTGVLNITGTGVVNVGGGTGTVTIADTQGSAGRLNLGTGGVAGTLSAGTVTSSRPFTAGVSFNHTGSYTFAPQLTGTIGVVKDGSGTTTLSAVNTHTGGTNVNAGTLLVNGNSAAANGAGLVQSGGTLGGTGTLGGANTVGDTGTIRGGDATGVGTLNLAGSLTIRSGGTFSTKIANTTTTSNLLAVTGAFAFNPGGRVFIDANNVTFDPATSYTYLIATSGTSTAGLSVTDQTLFSTSNFSNSSAFTFSLTGNAGGVIFLDFTPVPEPTTVLGLAAAGMGLAGMIRRRFRRSKVA